VMKIFLLVYMCHFAVGLTHCYKTTVFFTFITTMFEKKTEWCGCPTVKKFSDMFTRLDIMPANDRHSFLLMLRNLIPFSALSFTCVVFLLLKKPKLMRFCSFGRPILQ